MAYDPKNPLSNITDEELDEVLAFVAQLRRKDAAPPPEEEASPFSAGKAPESPAPREGGSPFVFDRSLKEEEAPPAPRTLADIAGDVRRQPEEAPRNVGDSPKKPPLGRRILHTVIPFKGDSTFEILRKALLLVALVVFIGSGAMLLNESVIIPRQNEKLADEIINIRNGEADPQIIAGRDAYTGYPEGIVDNMKTLYYLNNDVRGWLTYTPCGINREVMYSSVDQYYLFRDFYKNENKNGSLFFDVRNRLDSADSYNKSLVIYGHNMASGQMFAQLNQLASSLDTMKRANTAIKLDTLFSSAQYKIFAVVMQDSRARGNQYYSIQATEFAGDAAFMTYVEGLRARSLYDFPDVDVTASDEILILYTCTPNSLAGFEEGRLGVIARKVRPGESAAVNSANVTKNEDVIMPYAWYTARNLTPHSFYTDGVVPVTPTAPPTTATGGETTVSGDDVTATDSEPVDVTTAPVPTTPTPTAPTPTAPTPTAPAPTDPAPTDPDPTDPTEPTDPTDPTNPTEPTDPTEPTEPTDPTEPTEPTNPTDPTEPTEPAPSQPAEE